MRCKLFSVILLLCFISVSVYANDRADHDCNVVMRYAHYNSAGWYGFSFGVEVDKQLVSKDSKVIIAYSLNGGAWMYLDAEVSVQQVNPDQVYYYASFEYDSNDSSAPMYLNAVAFVKNGNDNLWDHNFESGDAGSVLLNSENGWTQWGLSKHCK